MTPVLDKFGNELRAGDNVCFIAAGGNWKQTPTIERVRICGFYTDKNGSSWVFPESDCVLKGIQSKIIASRVVKCY